MAPRPPPKLFAGPARFRYHIGIACPAGCLGVSLRHPHPCPVPTDMPGEPRMKIAAWLAIVVPLAACLPAQAAPALPPAGAEFFEAKVRPVLAEHCFSCHGEK